VKLVDLPELSYTAEDKPNPRGEIWVRGNNVFKEYYKDENATSQVLDTDGWFTTGLVGEVMANGSFKVIAKK
jgi:long-subunit acyl-CoA synthetase (AMP-forming)